MLMEEAYSCLEKQQIDALSLGTWHPLGSSCQVLRHHLHCENVFAASLCRNLSLSLSTAGAAPNSCSVVF